MAVTFLFQRGLFQGGLFQVYRHYPPVDFNLSCPVPTWEACAAFDLAATDECQRATPCMGSNPPVEGVISWQWSAGPGMVGKVGVRGIIAGGIAPGGQCVGQTGVQGVAYGDIGDVTGEMVGEYDPNAWRGPGTQPHCRHSDAPGNSRIEGIPWEYGLALRPSNSQNWADASGVAGETGAPMAFLERRPAFDIFRYTAATPLQASYDGPYIHARRCHDVREGRWTDGDPRHSQLISPFVLGWPHKRYCCLPYEVAGDRPSVPFAIAWKTPLRWKHGASQWWIPWGLGRRPPFIWPISPEPPEPPEPPAPFHGDPNLNLWCDLPGWMACTVFSLDEQPCRNAVPCHLYGLYRSFIIVVNTLSLTLTNGVQIPCESIEIKSDLDSWTWGLRATFKGYPPESLVEAQREVVATLDGNVFRFILETYDTSRVHGNIQGSATGRGLAAYLANPYSLPHSRIEATERTAVQCAEDELFGSGWTLDWQAVDWLLLPNTLAYGAETPLSAVKLIAESIGAVVQSHPEQETLTVLPRYPVNTWHLATASPDAVIPGDIVTSLSARWVPSPVYRGVWVSGRDQGVAVRVIRSGSDGDPYHQMIVDPLITHVDAGRERGRNIICAGGKRAMISVIIPLTSSPGVVLPGSIVRVDQSPWWKAYAYGVTITAQHGKVWQTVELERIYETP